MGVCAICRAAAVVFFCGLFAVDADSSPSGKASWRIEFSNDGLVGSDNQFTNGISIQKHSSTASSLAATTGTPAFGKALAGIFLPDKPGLLYREAWAIGQNLQTPDDIGRDDVILDDFPYVGMLGWENSYIAFNDSTFTGFQTLLGWVGEETLGEETQTFVHNVLDQVDPEGWGNQLASEPLFNLYYVKKQKLWRKPWFDGAVSYDAALGNFFTFAGVGLEMRFGHLPDGFAFIPDPIGRGMDYDATIDTGTQNRLYGSLTIRTQGLALALPRQGNRLRDGNRWTEDNLVDMEHVVSQFILGVHYQRKKWRLHLSYWISTDTVKARSINRREDRDNSFGTVTIEWRL